MNSETLRGREQQIARESFSSPASIEVVSTYISLPQDVRGLTMVDLCAGASPATYELQRRGARAIAVDYRYGDIKDLKRSVDGYLNKPGEMERQIDLGINAAEANLPFQKMDPRMREMMRNITKNFVKAATGNVGDNKGYTRMSRRARDLFFGRLEAPGIQAVAATAGSLPLADGSVDFAFSLQGVSQFLIKDRDVFMSSIEEALRVLKPGEGLKTGGQLQLHPWIGGAVQHNKGYNEIALGLHKYLESRGIPYFIEPVSRFSSARLRILKP